LTSAIRADEGPEHEGRRQRLAEHEMAERHAEQGVAKENTASRLAR